MAICRSCKRHVDGAVRTCPFCGNVMETAVTKDEVPNVKTPPSVQTPVYKGDNLHVLGSIVWCVIGFMFPIIGILAGVIWLTRNRVCSIATLIGAIGGFLFNFFFTGHVLIWYNALILLALSLFGIVPSVGDGLVLLSDVMSTPILSLIGL